MAKTVQPKKITTTHPRTGTRFSIDMEIYTPFKDAILQSLRGSQGKSFAQLSADVEKIIQKKLPGFKKSIPWYTISIRLDLETKGMIETFKEKGIKLSRLPIAPDGSK